MLKQQLIVLRRDRQRAPPDARPTGCTADSERSSLAPDASESSPSPPPLDTPRVPAALVRRNGTTACSHRGRARRRRDRRAERGTHSNHPRVTSRNPRFGSPRIARIISHTFGVDIDKNVVHRALAKHYRPTSGGTGPSWLSLIGHTTDSLWSVDLFRCESIVLQTHPVTLRVFDVRSGATSRVRADTSRRL